MTTATACPPGERPRKVFAVWFADLRRWSVNSFYTVCWHWPAKDIAPLARALERKSVSVNKKKIGLENLQLVTLHFDGEMEPRDTNGQAAFKGKLFEAVAGDVVYSKIDVRNGAIGVVPPEMPKVAVSSEYPVYHVRREAALPEYIKLLFRTHAFRRQINSMISGASGRKRVQPSDLEEIDVPLPRLPVQQAIVEHWNKARQTVDAAGRALSKLVADLERKLRRIYRRERTHDVIGTRYFVLNFKDMAAWDAKSGRAAAFRLACPGFRRMGEFIEDATELVRPAAEPDHDWPIYGVNNKEGVFLNCRQKGRDFNSAYKRIHKDWFFHNPTRCNVGSLGIVPDVPNDAITSPEYPVWRLKPDVPEPLLPGFVAVLIQTPFFIDLVQFNRVGAVKQRMYFENLAEVRVPYLPVREQKKFSEAREQALAQLADARRHAEKEKAKVEAMILGTVPVERGTQCE